MTATQFKQTRKSLGLSQVGLGYILGYNGQHISNLETGRRQVAHHTCWALVGVASQLKPEQCAKIMAIIEGEE